MPTVIKVENLSKKYLISHKKQEGYTALRDVVANKVKGLLSKDKKPNPAYEEFWALKDINFEAKQGERIGIIGRNGAGKTTLLKLLSRITEPTKGRISIRGRVGSLLEVGTGFHPELTGRENIFLNGAILGMIKFEIRKKFDEIVAFADVEKFLDTPVKHYSSGMRVRLAFAVAAHLEPEILLVDEVLAVGDMQFQKKCMGKMEEVSKKEGRTILFVSHSMTAIENLCSRCILLKSGKINKNGHPSDVVAYYTKTVANSNILALAERKDRIGDERLRFVNIETRVPLNIVKTGKEVCFRLHYSVQKDAVPLTNIAFSFSINGLDGRHILVFFTEATNSNVARIDKDGYIDCVIPFFPVAGGIYSVNLYASVNGIIADYILNAVLLNVNDADYYFDGVPRHPAHPVYITQHYWQR